MRTPLRIHRLVVGLLVLIMTGELLAALLGGLWMNAFLILGIVLVTLAPLLLGRHYRIYIPPEFQLLAVLFIFASLFLGEIHSYYEKLWWWDLVLHGSSGLLMGILGFLLVYVLNASDRLALDLAPRFVALFAFLFAVAVGVLWEIFEFSMDSLLGTNMQKAMLGDESGLTDTMIDLILDALGGLIISALGGWYMARRRESFIDQWIGKFIERNPRLFQRGAERARRLLGKS